VYKIYIQNFGRKILRTILDVCRQVSATNKQHPPTQHTLT